MLNNYEIKFSLRELLSAFFHHKCENLEFFKRQQFMYGTSSGSSAIFVALKDIQKKGGLGEIICPNYSCKAIPRAILRAGFKPVFVDVDKSLSLNIKELKKALNKNTKGIVFYHPWGFEHSKKILKLIKKTKIPIIEDCAQIISRGIGNWGDYGFFSFRTSKIIGVGSGALLLSKDKINVRLENPQKFLEFIDFIDLFFRSKFFNWSKPRAIFSRIFEIIGAKKMGEFQKTLLYMRAKEVRGIISKRKENYFFLKRAAEKTKNFQIIKLENAGCPLYFPILCSRVDDKSNAIKLFRKEGVNAQGYYYHINSDYFKGKVFGKENANFFAKRILSLPLHESLSQKEIEKIAQAILNVNKKLK